MDCKYPLTIKRFGMEGNMKLISFTIPCYNSAAYMDKCIQSVLAGGKDVEVIIVDDGSTKDDTARIPIL